MKTVMKRPRLIVGIVLALTLLAGFMATRIVLDNDVKIYFPEDHESYIRTKALDKTYGSQILLDICITSEEASFLTADTLEIIRSLVEDLEQIEYVQSVQAVTNTEYPAGSSEGMSVSTLVTEDFTGSSKDIEDLKMRLLDWPDAYARALYSDDFKATQILVRVDDEIHSEEMSKVYQQVVDLTEPYNMHPLSFRIAGDPVLSEVGKKFMYTDLAMLIPFVVVVLFLCLFFSFRQLSATILPLVTVLVATIWTVGTMAGAGMSFTIISSCLPVLIIAVGSAYGIHMINHYYHVKKTGKAGTPVEQNLKQALKEVRSPIFLAGFTTIIGFLSIMSSPIIPLKTFGFFAGLGTLYSLILSLTFIPALLTLDENRILRKNKNRKEVVEKTGDSKLLSGLVSLTGKYRIPTVVVIIVLVSLSVWRLFYINIESALIEYFPYDSEIRQDSRYISDTFAGTNTFNIVFSAPEGKNLSDPEALKAMDDLKNHLLDTYPDQVGKVISFSDFIKRMNQIMNYPADTNAADDSMDDMDSGDFAGTDDSFGMDAFAVGEDVSSSSFFDEPAADTAVSFFDEPAEDSGMGSFFDEPAAEESDSAAAAVTEEYLALDKELSCEELILLLQNSFAAVGDTNISVNELTQEIMKQTNYRGAAYNEIPYDPARYPVETREELQNLISQYLLLYSGSLDDYANDPLEPTEARMFVQLRSHDTSATAVIIEDVERYVEQNIPSEWMVHNAGIAEMELALTNMITSSQVLSLMLALAAVFLIIAVTYRSFIAGFYGIIPLGFSILINFGLMSILGINLDMVTSLIASIAIGIGVDYTVHFLARYRIELESSDNTAEVTKRTIQSTGRGIVINAVSVGLGFAVLIFSRFVVLRYIGLLTAIIMLTSSLAALTILPLLLNTFKPRFIRKPKK